MMDLSIPYYEDNSRVSNSAIGWFLKGGPMLFNAKLTGTAEEESSSALSRGTAIHMSLLQPEEFKESYFVWTANKPKSKQQEQFCQELVQSTEIEPNKALLEAYKRSYSTNGKQEDLMLSEALKIEKELHEYIEYLRNPERELLSMYEYQRIETIKKNVAEHKLANILLTPTEGEWHHEFHINWEYNKGDVQLSCKSLLDSICFNFDKKEVVLMDIKTTAKLHHFQDSINEYDYCRQLAFYTMALKWYLENERDVKDIEDWKISYYIIAIDTTGTSEVAVYKITEDHIFARVQTIVKALEDIHWHTVNNKWDHSREYYEGDGSETLSL